ncbi:MAG: hypothetical protein KO464_07200 [Candidatus Methanofastidiosum sp.]|nr:hypothetical protein [Methanofastidiosum sp.]
MEIIFSFFKKKNETPIVKEEIKTEAKKMAKEEKTAEQELTEMRKNAQRPKSIRAIVENIGQEGELITYEIRESGTGKTIGTVQAKGFFHLDEAMEKWQEENNIKLTWDYKSKDCSGYQNKTIKPDCKCEEDNA